MQNFTNTCPIIFIIKCDTTFNKWKITIITKSCVIFFSSNFFFLVHISPKDSEYIFSSVVVPSQEAISPMMVHPNEIEKLSILEGAIVTNVGNKRHVCR